MQGQQRQGHRRRVQDSRRQWSAHAHEIGDGQDKSAEAPLKSGCAPGRNFAWAHQHKAVMELHSFRGGAMKQFPHFCSNLFMGPRDKNRPKHYEKSIILRGIYTTLPPFHMRPGGTMEDTGKEGKKGGQVVKRCFYAERRKKENAHWNFASCSKPVILNTGALNNYLLQSQLHDDGKY